MQWLEHRLVGFDSLRKLDVLRGQRRFGPTVDRDAGTGRGREKETRHRDTMHAIRDFIVTTLHWPANFYG